MQEPRERLSFRMEVSNEEAVAVALARRIRDGDRGAESELVERYDAMIRAMLRRRVGDGAVDDLAQDVYCVVLPRLRSSGLAEPAKLANFVMGVVLRSAAAERRRARRALVVPVGDALPDPPDPRENPLARLLRHERRRLVRVAIALLSCDRDRQILERTYLFEEPKRDVCAALRLSAVHFDRVISRARGRMRQTLRS